MMAGAPLVFRTRATQNVGRGLVHGTDDQRVQQANLIEDRLRALEMLAVNVVARLNGSTTSSVAVTGLSNSLPKDVGAVDVIGAATTAARGDHAHRGTHTIAVLGDEGLVGDIVLVAEGSVTFETIGNEIHVSAPTLFEEVLTDSGDHIHYDFAGDYTMFALFVDGQKMTQAGVGADYTYAAPTVTFASARHADSVVEAVVLA